jgi:hypothetical protein
MKEFFELKKKEVLLERKQMKFDIFKFSTWVLPWWLVISK